jgi:hypothetical protein
MKGFTASAWVAIVFRALLASDAKSVVKIVDEKTVVRATWRNKPRNTSKREEMVITFGEPNYSERAFIKKCVKAGEPFPVKKLQYRAYPKKAVSK